MTTDKLIGQFDGAIWAKEFVKLVKEIPEIAQDESTMVTWFANAIMAGYDNARKSPLDELEWRKKRLNELKDITKIQTEDPASKTDLYMRGMANGLLLAVATLEGKDPEYIK